MFNPLNFINKIFKSDNEKQLKRLKNLVIQINNKEHEVKKIAQNEFPVKTLELKKAIKEGKISRVIAYDKTPPPPPPAEEGSDEEAPDEE